MRDVGSWRAEIPCAPPSENEMLRMHFRQRKELKDIWYLHLYTSFFNSGIRKAKIKRVVRITVRSKKERDRGNLWGPADKMILDNLTRLGFIVDDSPKWIDVDVQGEVGEPRTVVEVSEVVS